MPPPREGLTRNLALPASAPGGEPRAGQEVWTEVACGARAGGSPPAPQPGAHPEAGGWGGKGPRHPYTPSESQLFSTPITLSRPLLLGL